MTIAASLTRFARDAAHRQLFVPLDVLARHQVNREDIFAGVNSEALRAALGEMREHCAKHLAAAQAEFRIQRRCSFAGIVAHCAYRADVAPHGTARL